jgi:hypothetical protein
MDKLAQLRYLCSERCGHFVFDSESCHCEQCPLSAYFKDEEIKKLLQQEQHKKNKNTTVRYYSEQK